MIIVIVIIIVIIIIISSSSSMLCYYDAERFLKGKSRQLAHIDQAIRSQRPFIIKVR